MKWSSSFNHPQGLRFIIEHDENVGYYIYLYEDMNHYQNDLQQEEGCPSHQDDDLQDTLEFAKEVTQENFGVPMDSWVAVTPSQ